MMGEGNPQRAFFYNISLETFVPEDHPLRRIRPLIDDRAIRRACRDLYSPIGRPSIPPEQLFLALVGRLLAGGEQRSEAGDGIADAPGTLEPVAPTVPFRVNSLQPTLVQPFHRPGGSTRRRGTAGASSSTSTTATCVW
jgi:hypothetical protein